MTKQAVTALEFYSGTGGMRYALQTACPGATVLAAFDVNDTANAVYKHNFGDKPQQVDLSSKTAAQLDAHAADVWLMAPPCQPFTRQGKQLGAADTRSSSFLHLLQQLQLMQRPPQVLLVENVVGFQASDVHGQLMAALQWCRYHIQEFVLSPTQYGVPYSRPRYFCVASKQPLPVPLPGPQQPCLCPPGHLLKLWQQGASAADLQAAAEHQPVVHLQQVPTLGEYLSLPVEGAASHDQQHIQQDLKIPLRIQAGGHLRHGSGATTTADAGSNDAQQHTWVPESVLHKHADVIDVVSRSSRSCNCFTKAYGHFAKGTGSLFSTLPDPKLADDRWQLVDGSGSLFLKGYTAHRAAQSAHTQNEAGSVNEDELAAAWKKLRLRYFTVGEIAQLHSYPSSFQIPPGMSNRQGYQLLGNSLSVAVVADVLSYVLYCVAPPHQPLLW